MTSLGRVSTRKFKPLSTLTPYEQKIWDLYTSGHKPKAIAELIGAANPKIIAAKVRVIKQKKATDDQP